MIDPRIEFKPIESNPLHADADLGERAAHLGVEAVAIHAEIARRVAKADQARQERGAVAHVCHLRTLRWWGMTSNADPRLVRVARMRWNASLFTASRAVPCRGMPNRVLLMRAAGALRPLLAIRMWISGRAPGECAVADERVASGFRMLGEHPWQPAVSE